MSTSQLCIPAKFCTCQSFVQASYVYLGTEILIECGLQSQAFRGLHIHTW